MINLDVLRIKFKGEGNNLKADLNLIELESKNISTDFEFTFNKSKKTKEPNSNLHSKCLLFSIRTYVEDVTFFSTKVIEFLDEIKLDYYYDLIERFQEELISEKPGEFFEIEENQLNNYIKTIRYGKDKYNNIEFIYNSLDENITTCIINIVSKGTTINRTIKNDKQLKFKKKLLKKIKEDKKSRLFFLLNKGAL